MPTILHDVQNDADFTARTEKFQQGNRNVYSFTATMRDINNLMPDREAENQDRVIGTNRQLTLQHAKDIQTYLQKNPDWLVNSLLISVDPKYVRFDGYPEEDGSTSQEFGKLTILKTETGERAPILFDGQHRRRAIRDLMQWVISHKSDNQAQQLMRSKIPVLCYEEASEEKLRQMLIDHGRSKATQSNAVTMFDQQDPFNVATRLLVKRSKLFNGRVEMDRTTVARTSHCIIAVNQLAKALKHTELGYTGRLTDNKIFDYRREGPEGLSEKCLKWSDGFMPQARIEYDDLFNGAIRNASIPDRRPTSLAYNATVIRVLAGCYHEWSKSHDDWRPLASFIRQADFTPGRDVGQGALLVDAGLVSPGGITPVPRHQEVRSTIRYIVNQAY